MGLAVADYISGYMLPSFTTTEENLFLQYHPRSSMEYLEL